MLPPDSSHSKWRSCVNALDNVRSVKYLYSMPPANRHNPERQASSDSQFSLMEFNRQFPDDAACLEHLWRTRYSPDGTHAECPKCERERVFKRYATKQGRHSWCCTGCGHFIHPTAGTIFHKSSTSLHLWYYAMYSTRCGISAKQLERELGVHYKTAWRMFNRIRNELMKDGDHPLAGDVEIDETSVRGKPRGPQMSRKQAAAWRERQPKMLGMIERGGKVRLRVIPSRRGPALSREVVANVDPTSIIFTDDWQAYKPLRGQFLDHRIINHSAGIYVEGDVHTNPVEGFFGNLKTGMRGAYKHVSPKWLQSYLDEFAWRHNARYDSRSMFESLITKAARQ
jgi:transposase